MDIRIDTPADHCSTAEPLNDEQYIYAPFTDEEIAVDAEQDETPVDDIARGEELEHEYISETYPDAIDAEQTEEHAIEDEQDEAETVPKEEYDAVLDRYNRLMADWENYRRRTADEIASSKANANRNVVESMIPTLDNFGFALSHAQSMGDNPAAVEMAKGFEAIYRSLVDSLSREGLSVVNPAAGEPFDMNVHQAVEQVPGSEFPVDSIVRVLQVGYKFNDYVIRPALVAVAS